MKSCQRLKIDPLQLYGTNVVKCGDVREARPEAKCLEHLRRELAIVESQDHRRDGRGDGGRPQRGQGAARPGDRLRRPARSWSSRRAPRCSITPGHRRLARRAAPQGGRSGARSAASASGTTPSRRIDLTPRADCRLATPPPRRRGRRPRRLRLRQPAAPAPPVRADIMRLVGDRAARPLALLVWGLLPLHALGRPPARCSRRGRCRCAALLTWAGCGAAGQRGQGRGAASIGLWIAGELESVSAGSCSWPPSPPPSTSSAWPPVPPRPSSSRARSSSAISPWPSLGWGTATHEAYTGLGVSDVVFFALYLGAAQRFAPARRLERCALMVASFLLTIAARYVVDGAAGAAAAVGRLPRGERGPAARVRCAGTAPARSRSR